MGYYSTLIPDDKAVFLKTLASQYSVDHSVVLHLGKSLEVAHVRKSFILKLSVEIKLLMSTILELLSSEM